MCTLLVHWVDGVGPVRDGAFDYVPRGVVAFEGRAIVHRSTVRRHLSAAKRETRLDGRHRVLHVHRVESLVHFVLECLAPILTRACRVYAAAGPPQGINEGGGLSAETWVRDGTTGVSRR